ncbi:energy transducer TonB [Massilia sp. CCM 9210]|uniref:energy transducer TonB n=1 Tax=Massilia scottii TaxID=3057166 RepID=UPI0027965DDC|nr:energy transducer TonB [Massilia sp. CCM 9210]MDQ1817676.1 energy transducer TonB [Massilia sp. CCM 9210]
MKNGALLSPVRIGRLLLLASLLAASAGAQAQDSAGVAPTVAAAPPSDTPKTPDETPSVDVEARIVPSPWSPFRYCTSPDYPKGSLRNGEEGLVTAAFLVAQDGQVIDARVMKTSGFEALDKAAIRALLKCRFAPAVMFGVPIRKWMGTGYSFVIH